MKPFTNILLTSLSPQGDRKSHRYFSFEKNGQARYCDGLSVAEAGAKYILADVDIDEIIVLGAGRTYDEGEELKHVILREWSDYTVTDTADLSEYSFLQYRIAQFIDGLDMEAIDVLEDMDPARGEELLKALAKFCDGIADQPEYRPDRVFHMLAQSEPLFNRMIAELPPMTEKELLWLERTIYTKCADSMKLVCREDNNDIGICFIPTSRADTQNYVPAENVSQIVSVIKSYDAENINIYMDMQGLASTEGYTILAMLTMLSNDVHSRIHISEIITTHFRAGMFAGRIDNREMMRYDINKLVSGMSAFVQYGKVDEIMAYWKSRNIENKHVDSLLAAMRYIDEGISMCNTSDLETGINCLKYVFQNTPKEELKEVESNIFRILEDTIKPDYGKLLEGDSLDPVELVRWAVRKGFYQQSLTIIESRIPRDMVSSGIYYYATDDESRAKMMEEYNKLYWESAPKDRWGFDDLAHYFIKFYGRNQIREAHVLASGDKQRDFARFRIDALTEAPNMKKAYSVLSENLPLLENVLYVYYNLGDIRNKVNHAEERPVMAFTELDLNAENENLKMVREGLEFFLNVYDQARAYIKEHCTEAPAVVQIAKEEFREYTNTHKVYSDNRRGGYRGKRKPYNDRKADAPKPEEGSAPRPAEGAERKPEEGITPKPEEGSVPKPEGSAEAPVKPEADAKPAEPRHYESQPYRSSSSPARTTRSTGGNRNERHFTVSAGTRIVIDIEK